MDRIRVEGFPSTLNFIKLQSAAFALPGISLDECGVYEDI